MCCYESFRRYMAALNVYDTKSIRWLIVFWVHGFLQETPEGKAYFFILSNFYTDDFSNIYFQKHLVSHPHLCGDRSYIKAM